MMGKFVDQHTVEVSAEDKPTVSANLMLLYSW